MCGESRVLGPLQDPKGWWWWEGCVVVGTMVPSCPAAPSIAAAQLLCLGVPEAQFHFHAYFLRIFSYAALRAELLPA